MNACRFLEAKREQDRLFGHLDRMAEHQDPDWTHTRYSQGYFRSFVGRTIEDGARVFQSGGRLVAQLPDEWRFAKDEKDDGSKQKWYARDYDDSQWQLLKTYSASWEEQGLGWYKQSSAWYRVWIDIPAQHAGEDLRLWFGGVDETTEVYVNGQEVGAGQGFARPFEFPVGHLLQYGRKNLIAVKCQNRQLGELGTGGILRPVMLYAAGSKQEEKQ
jgi:beta-galactosidase/beta-glucuronidase